jgi:hypothetical protein
MALDRFHVFEKLHNFRGARIKGTYDNIDFGELQEFHGVGWRFSREHRMYLTE